MVKRVITSGTTSDNEWLRVRTSEATGDNEWQQMTSSGTTNGNECERMSAGKGEWFLFKNETNYTTYNYNIFSNIEYL